MHWADRITCAHSLTPVAIGRNRTHLYHSEDTEPTYCHSENAELILCHSEDARLTSVTLRTKDPPFVTLRTQDEESQSTAIILFVHYLLVEYFYQRLFALLRVINECLASVWFRVTNESSTGNIPRNKTIFFLL